MTTLEFSLELFPGSQMLLVLQDRLKVQKQQLRLKNLTGSLHHLT